VDAPAYALAWQRCGDPSGRERQIVLMRAVGEAMDALTHNSLLRHSLRLMRRPARAAGMAALQTFLETGFETFRAMRGAKEFLDLVSQRERALARWLFDCVVDEAGRLGQLP
jgi:hypothetical protein